MKNKLITGLLALGFILYLSLPAFAQTSITEANSMVTQFANNSKQIYRLDEDTRHAMWEALCGRMDAENIYDIQRCQEVIKEFQEKELGNLNYLLSGSANLVRNLERLREDPKVNRNDVDKLLSELNAEIERLTKLQGSGALKGSNNPFVQYAIEYGKKMHEDLQHSMGHDPKIFEKTFGNDNFRPDLVFIDGDGLWIYEFKPNTSAAINQGEGQLSKYKESVEGYFNGLFSNGRKGEVGSNSSDLGGEDFINPNPYYCKACHGPLLFAHNPPQNPSKKWPSVTPRMPSST
jgi:Restriction endonuclease fold toxin 9